jgi:hypothetical protein
MNYVKSFAIALGIVALATAIVAGLFYLGISAGPHAWAVVVFALLVGLAWYVVHQALGE